MSTTTDIWQDRWNNLKAVLDQKANTVLSDLSVDHAEDFGHMLVDLSAFAQCQFDYFHNQLTGGVKSPNLAYSHEFALTVTLNQVSYDLQTILLAVEQRRHFADSLNVADKIAKLALQPAIDADLIDVSEGKRPLLLCYYQKSSSIRKQPYSSVGLIGIPPTCVLSLDKTATNRDFLAVPHEVGHFVFWNGHRKQAETAKKRAKDKDPLKFATFMGYEIMKLGVSGYMPYWVEEVFADSYGARVAGPAIAASFQDMLKAQTMDSYYIRNVRYLPAPMIRPAIYFEALKGIKEQSQSKNPFLPKLEQRWSEFESKFFQKEGDQPHKTEKIRTFTTYERDQESVETAAFELRRVARKVNSYLQGVTPAPDFRLLTKNIESPVSEKKAPDIEVIHETFAAVYSEWQKFVSNHGTKIRRALRQASARSEPRNHVGYQSGWATCKSDNDNEKTKWELLNRELLDDESKLPGKFTYYNSTKELEWFVTMYVGGWTTDSPSGSSGVRRI